MCLDTQNFLIEFEILRQRLIAPIVELRRSNDRWTAPDPRAEWTDRVPACGRNGRPRGQYEGTFADVRPTLLTIPGGVRSSAGPGTPDKPGPTRGTWAVASW